MTDSIWSMILYPALAERLSDGQRQFLTILGEGLSELDRDRLQQALSQRITVEEVERRAIEIPGAQRRQLYALAKQIATRDGVPDSTRRALSELRSALAIRDERPVRAETALPTESNPFETRYTAIRSRFCRIATACSFIPLPFVSDAFVLVPIQVRMVERIAELFGYPLQAKAFVKMIVDKAGPEYASAIAGRMAISLVPVLGWLASAAITYGLTYAIAQVARTYIEREGELSKKDIQVLYREAFHHGKEEFESVKEIIKKDRDKLLARLKELGKNRPLVQKFQEHLQYIRDHVNSLNGTSRGQDLEILLHGRNSVGKHDEGDMEQRPDQIADQGFLAQRLHQRCEIDSFDDGVAHHGDDEGGDQDRLHRRCTAHQ